MKNQETRSNRLISGALMVILAAVMTGCPLLDLPAPLKPLAVEKEEKQAFKVDKEKNSVCRITKDFYGGQYVYDHLGRLYQYRSESRHVTFSYDAQGYLVTQTAVALLSGAAGSRWDYTYENGLISRVDSYVEKNGQMVLERQMRFEDGKPKTFSLINFNLAIDLKTNASGFVTEYSTILFSNDGNPITYFMEYDANGNVTKIYDTSPAPDTFTYRYSEAPNASYQVTRFKGHQYAGKLDYFSNELYVLNGEPWYQPNQVSYKEIIHPRLGSEVATYRFDGYNASGYPQIREMEEAGITRSAVYENCD